MRFLELSTAVSEIAQACKERPDGDSPFFFIVGAGISYPQIPLASQIEKECRSLASKLGRSQEPSDKNPLDTYSYWFEKAFPQPQQRQQYLQGLMRGKSISHATFRLAHLLLSSKLASIVVTPNFDDFLSRALLLFGKQHIICDHPRTVERIDPESDEVQLIHVHGTHWFYDCCNLRGEIEQRSQDSRGEAFTMTSLLDNILSRRSAIVIGYSGWEGDAIMNALQRRLRSPLRYNLYWFCFRRSDALVLPEWLKTANVRFVVPEVKTVRDQAVQDLSETEMPDLPQGEGNKGSLDIASSEPTLAARTVFDAFVRQFNLDPPLLTRDPLHFFATQLKNVFPQDPNEKPEDDIYELRHIIDQLNELRKQPPKKANQFETGIEEVRNALRRSNYIDAIEIAKSIATSSVPAKQREMLAQSISAAAASLEDQPLTKIAAYDLLLTIINDLHADQYDSPELALLTAQTLISKGAQLAQISRFDDALALFGQLHEQYKNTPDPKLRVQVAKALFNASIAWKSLEKEEQSLSSLDNLIDMFGDDEDAQIAEIVAAALNKKASYLEKKEQFAEALMLRERVATLSNSLSQLPARQLGSALFGIAWNHSKLKQLEAAVAAYSSFIDQHRESKDPDVRLLIAKAFNNKALILSNLARFGEALVTYDENIRRLAPESDVALLQRFAKALNGKGYCLAKLQQKAEAAAVYDEVLSRFGDTTDAGTLEEVKTARQKRAAITSVPVSRD